ncbi:MAG: hypothetical protein AAF515_11225 [Pseudomonadota bacterium]
MKQLPVEYDLWSAWFGAFGIWDSTINFWLTATFALVVASHTLRNTMTLGLRRILAYLYGAFCAYTLLRGISLYLEGLNISQAMIAHGIYFSPMSAWANLLSNVMIFVVFVFGSVGALRFLTSIQVSDSAGT